MFQFNRRRFLGALGKGTAALGVGLSFLGSGCRKQQAVKHTETYQERYARAKKASQGRKYIVGLSCGSESGNCETFLRAAAMGAAEFGVETEIIQAMTLNVLPYPGKPEEDDVDWIHEKTLLEDCALICAVPCYHIRANAIFYSINERMNPLQYEFPEIRKKTRVGAVIGVGGSGYDAWASLTNLSTQIFMQHTRKVVDQMLVTFSAFREWNLWMQQGQPLTSHTHLNRVIDNDYDTTRTMWGEQPDGLEFYRMAIERAKELGRNVARAMSMPIEEVKYLGEQAGVSCPLCHCNILLVPENLPYVGCPVCWIRGTITVDKGQMKVDWNMKDLDLQRFSYDGVMHHSAWLETHGERRRQYETEIEDIKQSVMSYGKIVSPYV